MLTLYTGCLGEEMLLWSNYYKLEQIQQFK